jgi:hypothetical protein
MNILDIHVQLVPSKLYPLIVLNHTHISPVFVINNIQSTHSGPLPLANVNVGACLSILISGDVFISSTFPAKSTL